MGHPGSRASSRFHEQLLHGRRAVFVLQARQVFNGSAQRGLPSSVQLQKFGIVGGKAAVLGEIE